MNGIWDEGEQFVEDAPTKADFTLNEVQFYLLEM